VSIALAAPASFKGVTYRALNPTWAILKKYKKDRDKVAFEKAYREQILSKLDPNKVYNDLSDAVILCWEQPNLFCHRNIVAAWLKETIGVEVPEL